MKSLSQPEVVDDLVTRLQALQPDTPRRWGSLTPHEMLCHLGDAAAGVMKRRDGPPRRGRPIKYLALYTSIPWPKGVATVDSVNPRVDGTRPTDFERDRARAIEGLRTMAAGASEDFAQTHFLFGAMSLGDWHRWAYRHTHHHLRQFGL